MKTVVLTFIALIFSAFSYASTPVVCSGGVDCKPNNWTDQHILDQQQLNTIQNTNVASMANQLQLQSPLIQAPVSTMGSEYDTCPNDYFYTGAGASRAALSGVEGNAFGNGSWAVGLQAGWVHILGNSDCKKSQTWRYKRLRTDAMIGLRVGCLNLIGRVEQNGIEDARPVMVDDKELWKTCGKIADAYYLSKELQTTEFQNIPKPQPQVVYKEPEFEEVIVGYNQYRLHFGDFHGCDACGGVTYKDARNTLLEKGVKPEHIYIKDFKKDGRVLYSVNILRNDFLTVTNTDIAQQEYYVSGIHGLRVKPLRSSAIRKQRQVK